MLLQQPHGDPEIQHYEKFQQRINKKNRAGSRNSYRSKARKSAVFVSDEQTSAAGR